MRGQSIAPDAAQAMMPSPTWQKLGLQPLFVKRQNFLLGTRVWLRSGTGRCPGEEKISASHACLASLESTSASDFSRASPLLTARYTIPSCPVVRFLLRLRNFLS